MKTRIAWFLAIAVVVLYSRGDACGCVSFETPEQEAIGRLDGWAMSAMVLILLANLAWTAISLKRNGYKEEAKKHFRRWSLYLIIILAIFVFGMSYAYKYYDYGGF